jgi:D-sorbitol dehydrogenase (acceptor)
MSGQLHGKCILITGAAQGIGLECARSYVREGARVAIADIDHQQAQQAAKELGPSAFSVPCDVANGTSIANAVERILADRNNRRGP